MPVNSKIPNQANFQTNQNFDIDLDTIYSDFIQDIDAHRSIVNIQVNKTKLNVFDVKTIAGLNRFLKVESTPQESRVSAFYRLIGFPVVSSNMDYYNPGLDTITGTKAIDLSKKITIANSPIDGFQSLSLQRENLINQAAQIFSITPSTITASALALTSSSHTRKFAIPVTSKSAFDTDTDNQSYTPSLKTVVGRNNQVTLDQYVDELGNTPDKNTISGKRFHIIKPFIVDPRIDFSVNPASRKVAVPFAPVKQNLLVSENTYVERPLIEKVIRDRFGQNQGAVVSASQQKSIDYILNVPTVKNDSIIQQMISDPYLTTVQAQFQKYLFMIQAMCVKLVNAQIDIQKIQSHYYWVPLPSNTGPEGGSDIKGPILSQKLPNGPNFSLITIFDQDIINNTLLQASSTFQTQTASLNGKPSLGPFAFDNFKTFDTDTTIGFGDNASQELSTLTKKRNSELTAANKALQTIEIIMGEWSGLGLCDIIAVMGALYIMPQDDLLGFLDPDAFSRMETALNITGKSNPGISKAQDSFINSINDMYNLMDDIYQNLFQSKGLIT